MGCGAWCVYYRDRGKTSACTNCSNYIYNSKPKSSLGPVDPFRLAKLLKEKKEKERRDKIPRLSDCPRCLKPSLFYNSIDDTFECLNLECSIHNIPITADTEEYQLIVNRN